MSFTYDLAKATTTGFPTTSGGGYLTETGHVDIGEGGSPSSSFIADIGRTTYKIGNTELELQCTGSGIDTDAMNTQATRAFRDTDFSDDQIGTTKSYYTQLLSYITQPIVLTNHPSAFDDTTHYLLTANGPNNAADPRPLAHFEKSGDNIAVTTSAPYYIRNMRDNQYFHMDELKISSKFRLTDQGYQFESITVSGADAELFNKGMAQKKHEELILLLSLRTILRANANTALIKKTIEAKGESFLTSFRSLAADSNCTESTLTTFISSLQATPARSSVPPTTPAPRTRGGTATPRTFSPASSVSARSPISTAGGSEHTEEGSKPKAWYERPSFWIAAVITAAVITAAVAAVVFTCGIAAIPLIGAAIMATNTAIAIGAGAAATVVVAGAVGAAASQDKRPSTTSFFSRWLGSNKPPKTAGPLPDDPARPLAA